MTLKQLMDANTNDEMLVSLFNNGQDKPFAKVSDGSVDALSSTIQALDIARFTIVSPSALSVYLDTITPITLSAVDGLETLFNVEVSEMQTGVSVNGDKITGTLKRLTGENPITEHWGEGNFLCLQFSTTWSEFDSVKVGLNPSQSSGLVEIINDPDKNGVFKITNKNTQKFVVQATKGTGVYTFYYDLSGLTVE